MPICPFFIKKYSSISIPSLYYCYLLSTIPSAFRKEVLLNPLLVLLMIRLRESIQLTNRKAQNKVFWALTSTEN